MMFNKRPRMRFNPPPNWPPTPQGWTPPPEWSPDPEWGPVPGGWQLWVEEADGQGQNWFVRHKVLTGIGAGVTALMLLCCGIGALAPNSNDKDTVRTAAATSAAVTSAAAEKAAAEKAAAEKVAAEKAAAEKAAAEKAAADKAAAEKAAREKAAREKAAREKAAREKAAKEKAARRKVAMPDLVGLKLNIAMDVVHNVGLTDVSVCRTPGGSIPLWYSHWRVIGQDVSAGKRIRVGTEVCLDAMKDSDM